MHPLLVGRLRPGLYLAAWAGIGALLAVLLAMLQPRPPLQAALFVAPLIVVYAFACLSAVWVCRAHPLGATPALRLVVGLAGSALQASAVWVAIAALWAVLLARAYHVTPDRAHIFRDLTLMGVAGVVLY